MQITKISIRPTEHYLLYHSDVRWDLVVAAILSPSKTHPNERRGKDRYTYIRYGKRSVTEVHVKIDPTENVVWVINAFRVKKEV